MKYQCHVTVRYPDRLTRLEKLRAVEAAQREMTDLLAMLERAWETSDQTFDERRDSCTAVVCALASFAKKFGVSGFTNERLNDLCIALDELMKGRKSALLQRSDMPTRTPANTDFTNQAIAQVCAEMFRAAGLSASEAWTRTASLFQRKGFKNFGVHKIKSLASRLRGPGASMEGGYEQYQFIRKLALGMADTPDGAWSTSEHTAAAIAHDLVEKARQLDHRLAA